MVFGHFYPPHRVLRGRIVGPTMKSVYMKVQHKFSKEVQYALIDDGKFLQTNTP